jgi:hypothetical protein
MTSVSIVCICLRRGCDDVIPADASVLPVDLQSLEQSVAYAVTTDTLVRLSPSPNPGLRRRTALNAVIYSSLTAYRH